MINLCQRDETAPPEVVIDEYVPVTVTWPEAHRLLDPPRYRTYSGAGRLLELKFHPHRHQLLEVVLVSAAGIQRGEGSLEPSSEGGVVTACLSEDGPETEDGELSRLIAYDDCLVIGLAPKVPSSWVGTEPVLLGIDEASDVVALGVMWGPPERELCLSGIV